MKKLKPKQKAHQVRKARKGNRSRAVVPTIIPAEEIAKLVAENKRRVYGR